MYVILRPEKSCVHLKPRTFYELVLAHRKRKEIELCTQQGTVDQ